MVATNKSYKEEIDALLEGGADVNATHEVRKVEHLSLSLNITIYG